MLMTTHLQAQITPISPGFRLVWDNMVAAYRSIQPLAWLMLPTLMLLSIIYAANFADPFIDHDDYPFFTSPGASNWYFTNYLPQEGRWLLWIWTHYSSILPASTMFTLNVLLWGASCSVIAFLTPFGTAATPARIGLALVLAASPHFSYEIRWPFATFPIFAMLLLVSFAANYIEQRRLHVVLLAGLMFLTMISFQALAFYFLGIALMTFCARLLLDFRERVPDRGEISDAIGLAVMGVAVWLGACVIAILAQYSLQYIAFDTFGLQVGEWRIKGAYRNESSFLDKVVYALAQPWRIATVYYADAWLAVVGTVLAGSVLIWRMVLDVLGGRANRAVLWAFILAGQISLFFIIAGVTLLSGAYVPVRAGFVCWVAFTSPVWMLMIVASGPWQRGCAVAATALVLMCAASANGFFIEKMRSARADDIQFLTSVKQRIEAKFGNYNQQVLLVGIPPHLTGHPHLFFDDVGLAGLMNHKIKIKNFVACANILKSHYCQQAALSAGAIQALNNAPIYPSELALFQSGDKIFIKLGPLQLRAGKK